jgi:hypothetical protein
MFSALKIIISQRKYVTNFDQKHVKILLFIEKYYSNKLMRYIAHPFLLKLIVSIYINIVVHMLRNIFLFNSDFMKDIIFVSLFKYNLKIIKSHASDY